jgi:uncharacterized membrane protein
VADLIVIGYPDEGTADRALTTVEELQRELVLEVDGVAAIVRHSDGKVKVNAPGSGSMVGVGALSGVLWGTVLGMLFLVPVLGAVTGGLFGTLFGALSRSGIDESFRERVQERLQPGTSALVIVVENVAPERAVEALSEYGGEVLQTSLSRDAERELQEALRGEYTPRAA